MLGTIQVRSPAFVASGVLPQRYTCRGAGIAPPLAWTGVPSGTRELVVFMIDISSKTQGTIAAGLAGIGPSVGSIAAGKIPSHAIVGRNGSGRIQWRGPCAQGQHDNLDFVIYAVRHRQHLRRGWSTRAVQRQLSQHALAAGAIGVSLK